MAGDRALDHSNSSRVSFNNEILTNKKQQNLS